MSTVNEKMTALADEVRALSGTTTKKGIDAMTTDVNAANTEIIEQADLIAQITTALEGKAAGGGVELPSLSNPAGAADILSGKEAIDGEGNKITGTIPSKAATTYTPSTTDQTIPSGTYLSGTQTIKGDSRLLAENIKSGTSIFGVMGTYEGEGSGGGSIETCTGSIVLDAPVGEDFTVYTVNNNLQVETISFDRMDLMMNGGTFTASKGTIVAVKPWATMYKTSGGCTACFASSNGAAFVVTDDFTITYG